jgi:serine protease inhibitor
MTIGAGLFLAMFILLSLSISMSRRTEGAVTVMAYTDGMSAAHAPAGPPPANSAAVEARKPIAPVLPPGNFGSGTVDAVIATALYFKRQWGSAIDIGRTVSAYFTLCDGTPVLTDMMHRMGVYAYGRGDDFQAARLPFGHDHLSMVIVLPDPGISLRGFVSRISADDVNRWIGQLQTRFGRIALPVAMSTFGDSQIPLYRPLSVGIGVGASSAMEESITDSHPLAMAADRPFFYAIRDDHSEELLFIGTLVDPGRSANHAH